MTTLSLCSAFSSLTLTKSCTSSAASFRPSTTTLALQSDFVATRRIVVTPISCRPARPCRQASPRATSDVAVIEEAEAPIFPPLAAFKLHGTGRRKTAVARVGMLEGAGRIYVNGLTLHDYFQGQQLMIQTVKLPLSTLGYEAKYDLKIKCHGGGLNAQAEAIVLGIARALVMANSTNRSPLKAQGMLKRDPRSVERKKYGLKKARKAPQFSKR